MYFKNNRAIQLDATMTVGAEASNIINVAIQLKDLRNGNELTERAAVFAYFSNDANGDTNHGADANMSAAIGTDGVLMDLVTDGPYLLVSESDGDIDVNITKTDTGTIYLILVMPDGRLVPSGAITFA